MHFSSRLLLLNFFIVFLPPSSLRRSVSRVSLVTTVQLRDSWRLQDGAGKVSSVWRARIALTLLRETAEADRVQKVTRRTPLSVRNTGLDDRSSRVDHPLRSTIKKKRPFKPWS